MKRETILIIGGCRSGKSRYAEEWVSGRFRHRTFVATAVPGEDEEMLRRVELHRRQRKDGWKTIEEPLEIAGVLARSAEDTEVFLVDCLTLWLTNMMLNDFSDRQIEERVHELGKAIAVCPVSVVLVANEVGLGIVPESSLARRFRDLAGWCNQQIGACCERVFFVAAGLPLSMK